ncbi:MULTISPECIES: spore coat U domain-containing protein [unclassified Sphingomonas]|uniref:Csu type fimbrial protein n=1 Tax=unclassified Sphingomonas TaxID=196159 RepID=UPI0009E9C8F0
MLLPRWRWEESVAVSAFSREPLMRLFAIRCKQRLAVAAALLACSHPTTADAVSCTVSTMPVRFGVYNPLQTAPLTTTGTINVACTCTVVDCIAFGYRIDVSAGQSGNIAQRELRSGSKRLQYNLYSDPGFSGIWGSGIGGTGGVGVLYLLSLFGSRQPMTVYARLPARQTAQPGAYSDTPVVTIIY